MSLIVKKFDELTPTEVYEILRARAEIFVAEQRIVCADPDGVDYDALHCFYCENGRISAYLRAYTISEGTAKIGRVLTMTHGRGDGTRLMRESMPEIRERLGCDKIFVSAQKQAYGFYEKMGFLPTTEEYLEEGIVHIGMELVL